MAALCSLLVAVACDFRPNIYTAPTPGQLGRAEFSWVEHRYDCELGCDASAALASGAVASLRIDNAGELPAFSPESSEPAVFEVTASSEPGIIDVAGTRPGVAEVVLRAADGSEVDRVALRVLNPARIDAPSRLYTARYTVLNGGSARVPFSLVDADGEALVGAGAADYAVGGGLTPDHLELAAPAAELGAGESVEIVARSLGQGAVDVSASGGAALELPIEVVDTDSISRLELERSVLEDGSLEVRALPFTEAEVVHGASCAWTLEPADGPFTIAAEDARATVTATGTGTTVITCSIGSLSATSTLSF